LPAERPPARSGASHDQKKALYDEEELEILQSLEAGALKPVTDFAQRIKSHRAAASATFKKDQRLNIRISSRDLKNLQARALAEGIPYQTSAASLLHKYVSGQLVEHR
jgi:predicted DNA binding CopG/RHH family protein